APGAPLPHRADDRASADVSRAGADGDGSAAGRPGRGRRPRWCHAVGGSLVRMKVRPVTRPRLVEELAERVVRTAPARRVAVAVDGAEAADPSAWAEELVDPLRVRGRAALHVRAADFLLPASLRLEYG